MNKRIKIIWLDDDINLLNDAEPIFNEFGFEIIKCTSVSQTLNLVNNRETSNILLDINFPNNSKEGMDFLDVLKNINLKLNIVVLTGFPNTDDTVKAIKDLYAKDYIEKPIPVSPAQQHFFFERLKKAYTNSDVFDTKEKHRNNDVYRLNKLMILLIFIFGILAAIGGILAIIFSSESETLVKMFGQELKTYSVGVAFIFIGGLIVASTFKKIIKKIN